MCLAHFGAQLSDTATPDRWMYFDIVALLDFGEYACSLFGMKKNCTTPDGCVYNILYKLFMNSRYYFLGDIYI